jgi:hypothetical protein
VSTLLFVGAIVLVVAALLALDWVMAGRAARRTLRSARTGETTNLNADYGFVEQQGHALQDKGGGI